MHFAAFFDTADTKSIFPIGILFKKAAARPMNRSQIKFVIWINSVKREGKFTLSGRY